MRTVFSCLLLTALVAVPAAAQEIPLAGIGPFGAAVSPDGREVYVPLFGQFSPTFVQGDSAVVLDATTGAVLGTIRTGVQPEDVAFSPDGRQAFITNSGSASLTVVDVATRTVLATVDLGTPFQTFLFGIEVGRVLRYRVYTFRLFGWRIRFRIPEVRTFAYVTSTGGNFDGSEENIFVVDVDPGSGGYLQVVQKIALSGGFTRPDFRRGNRELVVPRGFPDNNFSASPQIAIFGTRRGDLREAIDIHPAPGGVHGFEDLAVSPDGRYAYVATHDFSGGTDEVFVVDLARRKIADIVRLGSPGVAQHGIASSPDGLLVLVTNFDVGTVSWIFTPTHTVIRETQVGAGPNEIAFTPDGRRIFVTNQLSNSVTRVDLPTSDRLVVDQVESALAAGGVPAGTARDLQRRVDRLKRAVARGQSRRARFLLTRLVDRVRRAASAGELVVGTPRDLFPPAAPPNQVDTPLESGGLDTVDPAAFSLSR